MLSRLTVLAFAAALMLAVAACATMGPRPEPSVEPAMTAETDAVARGYVKLVLAMGQHDPGYVDAYYGPPEWQTEAEAHAAGLPELRAGAEGLLARVRALPVPTDELAALRRRFLERHLRALLARLDFVGGKRLRFDEESRAFYDAVAPVVPEATFDSVRARLEALVPGPGALGDRVEALRRSVTVPPGRLAAVFDAAIAECRARTLRHLALPPGESFTVEYVRDRPWSAYNWYKGGYRSVIQVNTDLPVYVDRAVDLACHEGYPGHHVYNTLLEEHLVRGRGFIELSVYPLFSPMSLVAEGSANHGIDVAFPGDERVEFERRVLYPLAGLDPARAATYGKVVDLLRELRHATNQAARRYLDGQLDAAGTIAYLERYGLQNPDRARKALSFIDGYRSYVINYNVGRELVAAYLERQAGPAPTNERRWEALGRLLASPRLPADLLP